MIKLLNVLLVPTLVCSAFQDAKAEPVIAEQEMPCRYEIVADYEAECKEKCDTYAEKRDKTDKNAGIMTLEEKEKEFVRERGPLAGIIVKVEKQDKQKIKSASGEEVVFENADVFAQLEAKFEHMYEIREKLDEYERESAKLWSEYYALKDVYDRALKSLCENWAEDNGISFAPARTFGR
ncbi:MAG: hypothetical protein J6C23_00340 [Clostridia bacterium]|nr:hypothetical protein [Clostridia bacterium]